MLPKTNQPIKTVTKECPVTSDGFALSVRLFLLVNALIYVVFLCNGFHGLVGFWERRSLLIIFFNTVMGSTHYLLYGTSKIQKPNFQVPTTLHYQQVYPVCSRVNGSQKMHCITRPSIRALAKKVLSIENSSSQIKKPCAGGGGVAPFFAKMILPLYY